MSDLQAHPVADLFPMLATDELAELAADIKARGLIQPIVLDTDGRILDGRNRLAACELAGIEPTFETYDGDDPDGYALAVNVARRHLRPGQRYVLIEQARRLTRLPKSVTGVSINRLSEASIVLDYAPDLASTVVAGAMSLDSAAQAARERKREAAEIKIRRERLGSDAPDLADLVDDERMSVDDAIAALDARESKAKRDEEERRTAAQREADQLKQERADSLKRDRERIQMVVTGWSTIRDLILPDPDGDQAVEIVAGLGENDRLALKRLIADIQEQA